MVGHQEPERSGCFVCGRHGNIVLSCPMPCTECRKKRHASETCRSKTSRSSQNDLELNCVAKTLKKSKQVVAELYQVKRSFGEDNDLRKRTKIESLLNPVNSESKPEQWKQNLSSKNARNRRNPEFRDQQITAKELNIKDFLENAVVPTSLEVLLKEIGHLRTELKQLLMNPRKQNIETQSKPKDTRFITEKSSDDIEPLKKPS